MPRTLLILDLDETLAYATDEGGPEAGLPDFRVANFAVYRRPFLTEFLRTVSAWYDLAVWSSAGQTYVASIVGRLFPDPASLQFVWSCERCTRRLDPENQEFVWLKDLKKVRRAGYALERVLMIDDTPAKLGRHYGNHIRVRPFEGQRDDTELRDLLPFLERLRNIENVRRVEKRHWRLEAGIAGS